MAQKGTSEISRRMTIRDTGKGSAKACSYLSKFDRSLQNFEQIKASCSKLWEDPEFKCEASSLFYSDPSARPKYWKEITWKRPKEICRNPQMIVDGATRMDVNQGALGDCWLLAAVACLATREDLLQKVIPYTQSFDKDYSGIFKFNFWQYGRWIEVYVDDRLPTRNNQLIYMKSATPNEFWSALLEKAYAKLHGSYEALEGGNASEALTDFTGGIVKRFELRCNRPSDLFSIMLKAQEQSALMGCSTFGFDKKVDLANGLVGGHAYSVTNARYIKTTTKGMIKMVRVRNPWGDDSEWKGAWSDSAKEWKDVHILEQIRIGLSVSEDGEFWMSFEDFVQKFEDLEICYLGPDAWAADERQGKTWWKGQLFENQWRRGISAGGSQKYQKLFWTNPQYRVTVVDPDDTDDDDTGTILVGLMQKNRRKLKGQGKDELEIGYAIYKAPQTITNLTVFSQIFGSHVDDSRPALTSMREVSGHHKLTPGDYVIIPFTSDPNEEGEFILRIYSETSNTLAQWGDIRHVIQKAAGGR